MRTYSPDLLSVSRSMTSGRSMDTAAILAGISPSSAHSGASLPTTVWSQSVREMSPARRRSELRLLPPPKRPVELVVDVAVRPLCARHGRHPCRHEPVDGLEPDGQGQR